MGIQVGIVLAYAGLWASWEPALCPHCAPTLSLSLLLMVIRAHYSRKEAEGCLVHALWGAYTLSLSLLPPSDPLPSA